MFPCSRATGSGWGPWGASSSAPEKDIFHGLLIYNDAKDLRFVEASAIASLHEQGVDLRLDAAAAA